MRKTVKYLIIDKLGAILFNEQISHSTVALGFQQAKFKVDSGGFAVLNSRSVESTFGVCESIEGVSSKVGDEYVIEDCIFAQISHIKYFGATIEDIRNKRL